jgi:ABC-type Zn uptake system ZnuABC Zn-binding protein ZnuA
VNWARTPLTKANSAYSLVRPALITGKRELLSAARYLFVFAFLSALLAGCGGDDAADGTPGGPAPAVDHSGDPFQVVVSLPIFADLAREMGGNQVEVQWLIPPGEDPHTYVPTEEQAGLIEEADLVFVNGLGMDDPTIEFVEAHHPDRPLFMVDFVRNIPSPSRQQPLGGMPIFAKEVGDDPHLYLDPVLVPIYAETISHSLVIIDGLNEAYYDALFATYRERLAQLQSETADALAAIPAENRGIVAQHGSLFHYANRYGLSLAALDEDGEEAVAALLAEDPPPAVFVEAGMQSSTLESLAGEAGVEVCVVSGDTVDDESAAYIETMQETAEQLVNCLGGD